MSLNEYLVRLLLLSFPTLDINSVSGSSQGVYLAGPLYYCSEVSRRCLQKCNELSYIRNSKTLNSKKTPRTLALSTYIWACNVLTMRVYQRTHIIYANVYLSYGNVQITCVRRTCNINWGLWSLQGSIHASSLVRECSRVCLDEISVHSPTVSEGNDINSRTGVADSL